MRAAEARASVTEIDHTGDLGLEVRQRTLERLIEAALLAFQDVIVDVESVLPLETRTLTVEADDREALLRKTLAEVLWLYEVERWLVSEALVSIGTGERSLTATLSGEPFAPARHAVKTEVKAVTYHGLVVTPADGGWLARVILDL